MLDFFAIDEDRRGGDKFDYPEHEANIAESVQNKIMTGAITYEQFFRKKDIFSIYASSQRINRDSYYGAEQSLDDYGRTKDIALSVGTQYNAKFKKSNLILGVENNSAWLTDYKLGYLQVDSAEITNDTIISIPHTDNTLIADQFSTTTGIFAQYELQWKNVLISAGARYDMYSITDNASDDTKALSVLSPRISLKYDVKPFLQARLSYSQGYRAPQIFDEDLHIESSGSRKIIHRNAADLTQESSTSYMFSLDFNKKLGKINLGILAEAFYTKLNDPFVNEYGDADANGVVIYTRTNAESGAVVQGVNLEINFIPTSKLSIKTGFTIQKSEYEETQEFDEKAFFRTPNQYGYLTMDWQALTNFGMSATANYTGKMLVPYFGLQIADPDAGELRESESFVDLGAKLRYNIKLNGATLQIFGGVKNILNSYQNDFDEGINRDPAYIYGSGQPRTIYFGFKIGNFLK